MKTGDLVIKGMMTVVMGCTITAGVIWARVMREESKQRKQEKIR